MKSIKIEVVRTVTETEVYVIKMSDASAKRFLEKAPSLSKEAIAEEAEDMFQKAKRNMDTAGFTKKKTTDNLEKVNYARYKDCTGDDK